MQLFKLLKVLVLGGLTLTPLQGEASQQQPQQQQQQQRPVAAAKRAPRPKQSRTQRTAHLANMNLFLAPERSADLPLLSPFLLHDPPARAPQSRHRPIFTMEGILLGDYYLVPNLILVTDNRYDDANTRERALRDEMNYQDARRHGEMHEDPLTQLLRKRVLRLGGDPGFRVALVIHHFLQGALQPPVKSVDLVLRPDGQAYSAPAAGAVTPPGLLATMGINGYGVDKSSGNNPSSGFSSPGAK